MDLGPFRSLLLARIMFSLLGIACCGTLHGQEPAADASPLQSEEVELLHLFADALDRVEGNYVREIPRKELVEAAIRGMIAKLDTYSGYYSPEELSSLKAFVESEFAGVGITLALENDQLSVLTPIYGTPAYRAGLRGDDLILKIEDQETKGMTLAAAQQKIKGAAGTKLKLTVGKANEQESKTVVLTREVVPMETVVGNSRNAEDRWEYFLPEQNKLAYVRLTSFGKHTPDDLRTVCAQLVQQGMQGLVLDLRNNPGGLFPSAVEVSDLFVSEGKIVSTSGRGTKKQVWEAKSEGTFEGFPMVVLVNRYSASSSEIVAACLQDSTRAIVIGERSWGKGSVQNIVELVDGKSAIKLTTALYERPSGRNIHRMDGARLEEEWGVRPSEGMEVLLTDEENRVLSAERRQADRIVREANKTVPSPDFLKLDRQLFKGVEVLNQKINGATSK